jgi:hypothetical protein
MAVAGFDSPRTQRMLFRVRVCTFNPKLLKDYVQQFIGGISYESVCVLCVV